jgi:hypothetical protein
MLKRLHLQKLLLIKRKKMMKKQLPTELLLQLQSYKDSNFSNKITSNRLLPSKTLTT